MPGERRAYLVTVTEGPWNDWFLSASVADEQGRSVASVVRDDGIPLDGLLALVLAGAGDAIVGDFLTRRTQPGRVEQLRRSLLCRLVWLRNLRRRMRRRGR